MKSIKNPILIIFGLLVVYMGFRISPAYVFGDALFEWLKSVLFFASLFLIYQNYSYEFIKSSLNSSLSILGVILTGWGLFELVGLISKVQFSIPFSTYEITACFEHRNLYAQILFLTLPFQLFQSLKGKNKIIIATFSLSVVLSLFMLIILSNRAVWLAAILSFVVFGIMCFINYKKGTVLLSKSQAIRLFGMMVIGLVLAISFISFNNSATEIKNHSEEIFVVGQGTGNERLGLWERSIDIFKEHPVFGAGLSNWKIEVLKYSNDGLISEDHLTFYQRPHNDYLWILSETGLIGLLIYVLLIGLILFKAVHRGLPKNGFDNLFFIMLLMAIVGFLVFSFFSFPRERIYHQFLFTLFIAVIILSDDPSENEITKVVSWKFFVLIVFIMTISMASFWVGILRYHGELQTKNALTEKNDKNYPMIIEHIKEATRPLYQMDPTSTPLPWYSGFAYFKLNKPEKAKKHFLTAYSLNPYHIHVLNNLASTYAVLGQADSAIYFYGKAVVCAPNFDESWFNMSAVYFNSKMYEKSYEALKKVNLFTMDKRYKPFIKTIITALIKREIQLSGANQRVDLPDDEGWYFEVHKKLRNDRIPLKNLIFEDQILNQENFK